jgi:hypothetical protein
LFKFASLKKNYDQDLRKNEKNETEVHYLSIETKISTTKHKHHYEIHYEFRPWDGRQMVSAKSPILYCGLKYGLKYNNINTNTICSFRSTSN